MTDIYWTANLPTYWTWTCLEYNGSNNFPPNNYLLGPRDRHHLKLQKLGNSFPLPSLINLQSINNNKIVFNMGDIAGNLADARSFNLTLPTSHPPAPTPACNDLYGNYPWTKSHIPHV